MQYTATVLPALLSFAVFVGSSSQAASDSRPAPALSPILKALFRNDGEGFLDPARNQELKALLAGKPTLTFLEACGVGDAQAMKRFLVKEPNLAASWIDFGWSALHLAAFSGSAEAARLLLDRGADVGRP